MKKIIFLLFSLLYLCIGCTEPERRTLTKQEVIENAVQEKITRWRTSLRNKCAEDVLTAAGAITDSVLIARARLDTDSIPKPLRPIKPEKPEVKNPKDTLPIAPLPDTLPD